MSFAKDRKPVLVLGGGINGAAIARELVLNGQPVWLVESHDFAAGSTAYSSRLIHGGLRYLEFAEFDLVRESLGERRRLLKLAPDFVQPLELYIPVRSRFGGAWQSLSRFCGFGGGSGSSRGLWIVGCGLWFYDWYANDPTLPKHKVHRAKQAAIGGVNDERFRWMCSYWDGQIASPERFVIALLKDAAKVADAAGLDFRVLNYHEAHLAGSAAQVVPTQAIDGVKSELQPTAIINCTGAWVDNTLQKLEIKSEQLIGGTKGSHLFTWNNGLCERLAGRGIYVEARDGRPIFILPLRGGALIGTTDIHFKGDPTTATTSGEEIEYLLDAVNEVFDEIQLHQDDIAWHYSGVRPLPYVDKETTAGITRRHGLREHTGCEIPIYSVIGGKLTTCRSLAEEVVQLVLPKLGETVQQNSRDRRIEDGLFGDAHQAKSEEKVANTNIPISLVEHCICDEWVCCLEDLVERRLMLLYERDLSLSTVEHLANLLVQQGRLSEESKGDAISKCSRRLKEHFGLKL